MAYEHIESWAFERKRRRVTKLRRAWTTTSWCVCIRIYVRCASLTQFEPPSHRSPPPAPPFTKPHLATKLSRRRSSQASPLGSPISFRFFFLFIFELVQTTSAKIAHLDTAFPRHLNP